MLPFRIAKAVGTKAIKPSLYFAVIMSIGWLCVDLADGASDRFHERLGQVKNSSPVRTAEDGAASVGEYASRFWASIESNPGPSILAIVLFTVTVLYHKMKGRSTLAALKAGILKEAPVDPPLPSNPIYAKMLQQAAETQMLETYEKLEARQKTLPNEIQNAAAALKQSEAAYKRAQEAASRAENGYNKDKAYLERLQKEFDDGLKTLVELEAELNKA